MVKTTTLAAGAGIMTGMLTAGVWFYRLVILSSFWGTLTLALAILLIIDSILTSVGPKGVFYASAMLSALLAGSEWIGSGSAATVVTLLTVAMACITLVLSIVAARFEPKVSEQSHPMNLPVFG